LERLTSADVLMTRQNVASYDCRSDVSAGLPGIAYVTIGYEEEEEDYERLLVVAPPGKLGIVIDNPSGNIPFVHAIKETSVLKGRVHVGDLLLSVDEVDCRGMHSMSVSMLISNRSDSVRTLKLLRNISC
jgi:C-terminal processing protease CtpA/Prc